MRHLAFAFLAVMLTPSNAARAEPSPRDDQAKRREVMVAEQIEARGIRNPRVLRAMRVVPRHRFVPDSMKPYAYQDRPLPIGHDQTISALMSELAEIRPGARVLEVGTGSGYQAAVLAEMGAEVYSIEILEALAKRARATLFALGYSGVTVRAGDGYAGWPEKAPFDAILVTAAPGSIPPPLKQQLKVGGTLVIPVGDERQTLMRVRRTKSGFEERRVVPVRFVPMTGKARDQP
jgi:protein-L-isoaspartate(D-aspartate) O-methyltransferase